MTIKVHRIIKDEADERGSLGKELERRRYHQVVPIQISALKLFYKFGFDEQFGKFRVVGIALLGKQVDSS